MADSIGNAKRFTETYQDKDWDRCSKQMARESKNFDGNVKLSDGNIFAEYQKGVIGNKSGSSSINDMYDRIAKFREKAGLQPYSIDFGDTVAMVEVNGKHYFGVNSTISEQSKIATRPLRQKWLEKIQWSSYKQSTPKHLGHTQSLTHAEAHSLIRAFERQGSMPKKVTMYVDRKTYNICRGELPALLNIIGIEELVIYSGGSDIPTIIKP